MGVNFFPCGWMLVLVLGDLHIPYRAHELPEKFKKLLVPGKIQKILCTGNLCSKETFEYLKTLASDVHVLRETLTRAPTLSPRWWKWDNSRLVLSMVIRSCLGEIRSLIMLQRDMDVDILVSCHTHKYETFEANGKFFVNPGSATGAYSGFTSDVTPSFVLMDVQGNHAIVYTYELVNGEVKVDKFEHKKSA